MIDDPISKQDAIDALIEWYGCEPSDIGAFENIIEKLPSAQPEIIHCENCEHWKNNHLCECLSRYGTFETPKDFFCGYGEEK